MRYKENIKYLLYTLLFLLFFYTEKRLGISPFAIGLFMGAVYSKQNILILAPIYVICGIIISPTLIQLIYLLTPVAIVGVSFLVHYKLKKAVGLLPISLYTFFAQVPKIIFTANDTYLLINTVVTIFLAQIFTYICIMVLYAVLIRGLKYKLNFEETAAVAVFAAAIFTAFAIMTAKYINIYYLAAMLSILLSLHSGGRWTLPLSAIIGVGGAVAFGDIGALGIMVLWGCVAIALRRVHFILTGLAIILADVAINLFFTQAAGFNYYHLIYQGIGILIFALLPKRIKDIAVELASDYGSRRATRTIINRDRTKIAYKLSHLSHLFLEMKELLAADLASSSVANGNEVIVRDVMDTCCSRCTSLTTCEANLDITSAISAIVSRSLENEKATLLDAPPYLAAKCRNINKMIKSANTLAAKYNSAMEKMKNIDKGRMLLSEQMGGVGIILSNLQKDIAKQVKYDTKREKQLIEALNYNDIVVGEVIIYGEREVDNVTVIVREADQNNKKINEIINKILGQTLEEYYRENTLNNQVALHYGRAANYDIIYGEASAPREGEDTSGDCKRVVRLSHNNIMVILSDGMGHGRNAYESSSHAVDMLEHLYKAGYDHNTILTTVNALLNTRKREDYSAIDIVVVDTISGVADFIKLGGRESFIKRGDNIEVIQAGALPIGILEDIVPAIEQKALLSGDFVVLATDGVMDTLSSDMICEIIEDAHTHNPQVLADLLLENTLRISGGRLDDDTTCIVLKIFEK